MSDANPRNRSAAPKDGNNDDHVVDLTGDNGNDEDNATASGNVPPSKKKAKRQSRAIECGIVSYNLWFDQRHQARRMQAVSEAILSDPPHIAGLQEVTATLGPALFPILESVGYEIIQQREAQGFQSYGCAMAMNVDAVKVSGFERFPNSRQGRGLLWAVVEIDGLELMFASTHLESFVPGDDGVSQREQQALMWRKFAQDMFAQRPNLSAAILIGDLNWDDERVRSGAPNRPLVPLLGAEEWVDAWKDHNPHDMGYTYDGRLNPMLKGFRRRLDRCIIRSNIPVNVEEAELIGKQAIPGLEYNGRPVLPSDHFGLKVRLRFRAFT